ncbi:MAG: hypothetical protein QMC85_03960 [Methanocellales archaeon]|nr:hypothetical protein [Methanocellales archaeon]
MKEGVLRRNKGDRIPREDVKELMVQILHEGTKHQNALARELGISPNSLREIASELVGANKIKREKIGGIVLYSLR